MLITAAHNSDAEIRSASSAGGVFSILAGDIIARSGVVYGAAFDSEWKIIHRRVQTIAGLAALRGSKYAYSIIGSAIDDALTDLAAGRPVLFSGTPCQIAAMSRRAGNNPQLLLVEVVCHGAPEQRYWEQYLTELCAKQHRHVSQIESINFRDKSTGWKQYSLTIRFTDGKIFTQKHSDNLYMRAFLKDFTLREACFRCPFKYPDGTRADITLGDFWGIERLAPEIDNNQGTTIVIARTEKGIAATAALQGYRGLTLEEIAGSNPAIIRPATQNPLREQFNTASTPNLLRKLHRFAGRPLRERLRIRYYRLRLRIRTLIKGPIAL